MQILEQSFSPVGRPPPIRSSAGVQAFPTCGDRSSFQLSRDESTPNRTQRAAGNQHLVLGGQSQVGVLPPRQYKDARPDGRAMSQVSPPVSRYPAGFWSTGRGAELLIVAASETAAAYCPPRLCTGPTTKEQVRRLRLNTAEPRIQANGRSRPCSRSARLRWHRQGLLPQVQPHRRRPV